MPYGALFRLIMDISGVTGNLALSKEGLFILSIATVRGLDLKRYSIA